MSLNFSRGSIFCSYASKEEIWERLGYKIPETVSQSSLNHYSKESDREVTEKIEEVDSGEPTIDDILDLLPLDPFDKGKKSTAFSAFADWFKELEESFELGSDCSSLVDEEIGDGEVYAGLNWVYWNSAVLFKPQASDAKSMPCNEVNGMSFVLDGGESDFRGFNHGRAAKEVPYCGQADRTRYQGGEPHEAIAFALPYLDLKDLLSVEMVCRSLRDEVRSNTLLWRSISIVEPLNWKLNDDALLNLTSRAEGTLESLTLMQCYWIHNDALKCVLDNNPKLKKLCLPGCTRIHVKDVLDDLREMKSAGKLGIKLLRLGGLWGRTSANLAELKHLLSVEDNQKPHIPNKPVFYNYVQPYILSDDDDRAIDIEPCPKCEDVTLVYDCPLKSCQEKHEATQSCRGCLVCINRCSVCGCCSEEPEFYEELWYNFFCEDCYEEPEPCQKPKQPVEEIISSTCEVFICG